MSPALWGVAACAGAVTIATYLVLSPGPVRLPLERRRPESTADVGRLTGAASAATAVLAKILTRRDGAEAGIAATLERAGVQKRPQDVVFLVAVAALAAGAVGLVLAGPLLGLVLGALMPVVAKVRLGALVRRRRSAFADQLDDSLQLMASSLRAGHSLLQALASVAREAEEPTSAEFSRIINETRVGRPGADALEETAQRMDNEDFAWVTQAIAINREVGGNLAEVLDGVGHTIRERNQIRGQVKALSSEGKLSAVVLMALPFGIVAFLSLSNPEYLAKFTQSLAGYAMIGAAVVLLIVGALWLRKVVSFKF